MTYTVVSSYDYDLKLDVKSSSSSHDGNSTSRTRTTSSDSASSRDTSTLGEEEPPSPLLMEQDSIYLDESDEEKSAKHEAAKEMGDPKEASTTTTTATTTTTPELDESDPIVNQAKKEARKAKISAKMKLAEERYFVRRYQVAQTFVLSATKHLHLDENAAPIRTEFLPQLDDLLEAPKTDNITKTNNKTIHQVLRNPEEHAKQMKDATMGINATGSTESLQSLDNDTLQGYLDQLSSPEAAYKCLSWVLFQYLLQDAKERGYDARVRFWFKRLAVTLWYWSMQKQTQLPQLDNGGNGGDDTETAPTKQEMVQRATRKFEALESCCADRLLTLAAASGGSSSSGKQEGEEGGSPSAPRRKSSLGRNIWKGIQIGGVGLGAGVLLAVTGGLAAPGIAAGLATLGMGAVAGTFLSLASSAAVVSLFGVAGGTLAGYKMSRRVSGLTEFTIQQELPKAKEKEDEKQQAHAQLCRTICVSGWLHNETDFQRPWGVTPTNPPITNKVELLERFYKVHNSELVPLAKHIWQKHKENPERLWELLEEKYGSNPDHLFESTNSDNALSEEEITQLDQVIVGIGTLEGGEGAKKKETPAVPTKKTPAEEQQTQVEEVKHPGKDKKEGGLGLLRGWGHNSFNKKEGKEYNTEDFEKVVVRKDNDHYKAPAYLNTVWNYPDRYGGELFTVRWQSDVLAELSESVNKLAVDMATSAGSQVAKTTVAATLVVAVYVPWTIMQVNYSLSLRLAL